jgi:hypothetical protein
VSHRGTKFNSRAPLIAGRFLFLLLFAFRFQLFAFSYPPPMGQPHLFSAWMYYPAAVLAALGLILFYFALFHNRAKGRPRCPKCWYDMTGNTALPARCPECGHLTQAPTGLLKTRRRWRWAPLALLLIAPLAVVFANLHAMKVYYAVMPRWALAEETRVDQTYIRRYHARDPDDSGERVTVTSNGKTLIDREDRAVSLSQPERGRATLVDVDGDGVKECIIECYSGGAHCCYRVYIVELRPAGAVVVADIDAGNGMIADYNPAGGTLFDIPDGSFDYWKTSHAESPAPIVHYRLKDGALRIALDRMEQAVPSTRADALANESAVVAFESGQTQPSPILWRTMLELIYSGHEPQAWVFFDRTWPSARPGKEAFRKEFLQVLATDPWYQDLTAALAARAAGKPIPPSVVGMSGRAGDAK